MNDYIVQVEFFQDDSVGFYHFCSDADLASPGNFADAYDCLFSYGYAVDDFRILSITAGF